MEKFDETDIRLLMFASTISLGLGGALVGEMFDSATLYKHQGLENQVQNQQVVVNGLKAAAGPIEAQARGTAVSAAINHTIQKETAKLNTLTAETEHVHTHELQDTGIGITSGAMSAIAIGCAVIYVRRHRRADRAEVNQPAITLS